MRNRVQDNLKLISSRIKLLSIELIIVLVSFLISFFAMVYIIRRIFFYKKELMDQHIFQLLSGYVSDTHTAVMNFFTFFGSQYFLIPANLLLIAWAFYNNRDKWFGIRVASLSISSLLLMFALKQFFNRPRPLTPLLREAKGLSFPSGHAFMSFVFFGLLIYVIHRKVSNKVLRISLTILLLCFTFMIGLSRIYLRVHYASDVIAGFSMGLMWLVISMWIIHIIEKHKTSLPALK
ncbi:MAG: phosphatase PAP2 family protein [Ferruginibacter sp.]